MDRQLLRPKRKTARRKTGDSAEMPDSLSHLPAQARSIVQLQRLVGNQAVQRLIQANALPGAALQRETDTKAPPVTVTGENGETMDFDDAYAGYNIDTAKAVEAMVKYFRGDDKSGKRRLFFHQVQAFLGVGLLSPYYIKPWSSASDNKKRESDKEEDWKNLLEPTVIAIATWQHQYKKGLKTERTPNIDAGLAEKITVDGILSPETEQALKSNGAIKTAAQWQESDKADFKDVRADEAEMKKRVENNPGSSGTAGLAIVDLARSQVGEVYSMSRGDGNKYGWERIARFYEVAFGGMPVPDATAKDPKTAPKVELGADKFFDRDMTTDTDGSKVPNYTGDKGSEKLSARGKAKDLPGIRKAGHFAHGVEGGEKAGAWSWCGIFTMWAVKSVTGKGYWQDGPQGLTKRPKAGLEGMLTAKKGDILNLNSPQNHFIILAQDISPDAKENDHFRAIEGNLQHQEIIDAQRWRMKDVINIYTALD